MNYPLVGAFVLLLGALLVGGVLWIASGGRLQKQYDLFSVVAEESVAGLSLNAPVKYNGVDVGKVSDIRLDPVDPERVRLTLAIERGTPIKVDTVAILQTQGLTGITYLELDGGSRDALPLKARAQAPYPVIGTKPSRIARLDSVLTTVLDKLDGASTKVDAVLSDDNRAALKGALADIAAVSRTLAARQDVIDAGIVNAARAAEGSARVMAQLGPVITRMGRAADALETMGSDVALAADSAAQAASAVGADAKAVAAEALPEIRRLLGELNDLSSSLRRLSEQTARNPAGLLRGPSPVPAGPGEAAVAEQQR